MLSHLMKVAKRHSRSRVVTLLHLRNAFVEFSHDLIRTSMEYHHLPTPFKEIFNDIYSRSQIQIALGNDWTDRIGIPKCVLQGIHVPHYCPISVSIHWCIHWRNHHWIQLDTYGDWILHLTLAHGCSLPTMRLLSRKVFQTHRCCSTYLLHGAWCNWSNMSIRLGKCCTFGIMKWSGIMVQIEPGLYIQSEKISSVQKNASFVYLGKTFDFEMKNRIARETICIKLKDLLTVTSNLQVKPQTKPKILQLYIHSQLSFEFKIYNFGSTWIEQNLDSMCDNQVRLWMKMPVSSCVSEVMSMPKYKGGFGIPSFKESYKKMGLSERLSLKSSEDGDINQIWKDTRSNFVEHETLKEPKTIFFVWNRMAFQQKR